MKPYFPKFLLNTLFRLSSHLADITGGRAIFVTAKISIGAILLSSNTAKAQNNNRKQEKTKQQAALPVKQSSTNQETVFCYITEQMPQFPGGDSELLKFLSKNIKYPDSVLKRKIQGRVIVRFVITQTGKVKDVRVIRSLDPDCDNEAIRVVKLMPDWIPGSQNGEKCDVSYTLPLNFRLSK